MRFYGNILASAYKFYGRFRNEDPYYSSIFYTGACHMLMLFILIVLWNKVFDMDLFKIIPNVKSIGKYVGTCFAIVMMTVYFLYYTQQRVAITVEKFDKKPLWKRILWGIIAWISMLAPMAYIVFQ